MTKQDTYGQCEATVYHSGSLHGFRCSYKATTTVANYQGSTVSSQLCTFHNPEHKRERRAKRGPTNAQVKIGLMMRERRDSDNVKKENAELKKENAELKAEVAQLQQEKLDAMPIVSRMIYEAKLRGEE